MADPRDERGTGGRDQRGNGPFALPAGGYGDPNFDEFMIMQCTIQFRDNAGRHSGAADTHERLQGVAEATQAFLFGFRQQHLIHYSGDACAHRMTYVRIFE